MIVRRWVANEWGRLLGVLPSLCAHSHGGESVIHAFHELSVHELIRMCVADSTGGRYVEVKSV